MEKDKLAVFQNRNIRQKWHDEEWYFSVVDIIAVLTDNTTFQQSRKYWNKLSQRLKKEGSEAVTHCHQLKMLAEDGKQRLTDCANTKTLFRIIQSIPSKKSEPFKLWLAQVGHERIQEIENPELAQERTKEYYELKGYPKEWIDKRLRGIAVRQELTEEWKKRGVEEKKEYAILTNEISKATFGIDIQNHKKLKDLKPTFKNQNLRDHMTDLELIFNMLGEASTTAITKEEDSKGFEENKKSAQKGGGIAGKARENLEKTLGKSVVSEKNQLAQEKKKKKLR